MLIACLDAAKAEAPADSTESNFEKLRSQIADIELTDQDGKQVRLYNELIKGRVVALSFIFTDCPGICPPIGASIGNVQKLLGDKVGTEIGLITVSVNPRADTPEKMKAWGDKFGAKNGWVLLTDKEGRKDKVDELTKALKVYTPDFEDHSPFILLVDDIGGRIDRIHGIASTPSQISAKLLSMAERKDLPKPEGPAQSASEDSPSKRYFGDAELIDQDGKSQKLYSDLLKGKVVVIGSFFATCKGVCPVMMSTLEKIQDSLGDHMGKDVHFISISVDPLIDTPEELGKFADRFHAGPGWYFLTGEKDTVEQTLFRLGFHTEAKESHTNVLIMGNEPTGLWKKAKGMSSAESLATVLQSVLDDKE